MKQKTRTRVLSWLLSLVMILSLVPGMSITAYAAGVSYVDGSGTAQTVDATELAAGTTSWTNGSWYIVPAGGLIISSRITVNGTVNLILRDGATLTANAGITTTNATLNIYAQSNGTGALIATGSNGDDYSGGGAGIGGGGGGNNANGGAGGNVNIYGGTVTATGGNGGEHSGCGAGIGGGGGGCEANGGAGGTVNIYGGMVTATGDNGYQYFCGGGAGIGGGGAGDIASGGAGANVNIYGGTVTAKGGNSANGGANNGAGIGGGGIGGDDEGSAGASGTLTLGKGVKLYNGTDNTGTVLDESNSAERSYSGSRPQNMFAEYVNPHTHDFTYTADGDTITATCSADGCTLDDGNGNHSATLTIAAPAESDTGGAATITDAAGIQGTAKVMYELRTSGGWSTASETVPSTDGVYRASITLRDATASVTYGVNAITKGTATGDNCDFTVPRVATVGAKVTPALTLALGYEVKKITVKDASNNDVSNNDSVKADKSGFTMPDYNVTVDIEFGKIDYRFTKNTMAYGSVTVKNSEEQEITTAHYGDTITLVVAPETNFTLKTLTAKDSKGDMITLSGEGDTRTFTMPASDITVSAEFEGKPFGITTEVSPANGGTVTVSGTGVDTQTGTTAKAGSTVTLTVEAATGFTLENVTVKKASGGTVTVTDNKFIMPTEAVIVSATFAGHDTTATLSVAGDKGPTCTAKLLHDDFTEVTNDKPLTKKGGEQFILLANRDEGYDFTVTYGMANSPVTLTEFTEDEYKAYVAYAKDNNLAVSSSMILAWAMMPGVEGGNVTLTANFAKLKTFTILYQPTDNPDNVWCKFAYTEAGSLATDSAQMKSDTVMGDGTKVYSLKVTAAFNPEKVAFATDENSLGSAAMDDATVSQNTDSWNEITGGSYVVIGGDAKTVVAAFVTDTNSIKVYNGNSNRKDMGQNVKDTSGVTYRLAIVTESEGTVTPGTVKAPKAPVNNDESIQFAGWWGFEYDDEGNKIVYAAEAPNVPVRENTTFIDTWKPAELTVTLNLNGGTGVTTNQPVTYGETMEKPTDPTRYSFAFEGWRVNKTVTEGGQLFVKGTPFVDFENTKITADMGLTAQWKHVHTYTCYRVTLFSKEYHGYDSSVHVALCACGNSRLEAHAFDSNGKCACGYEKPAPVPVKLDISYGQWNTANNTYTQHFKGLPQPMKPHLGEEVTISAPNIFGEGSQFSKWQFSTDDGETWTDLAAAERVSFIIPCDNLKLRGLYVNTVTNPQVELSASKYKQDVEVKGYKFKADNILFQMHYKLPDGYTFVDAGVRVGDNDGIVYYELKEKTHEMSTGSKVMAWTGCIFGDFFSGGAPDTSYTEKYYEVRKSNAVADLGAAKVAKYMYENEPVSAKAAPILYEAKSTTKGSSGSVATIPPIGLAQSENQNNWIYGIGWLRYETPQGEVETIYTDALAATLNNMPTDTVTKQGS